MAFRLVNKHRMLKPGQCLVCDRVPTARVVDTGMNLMGVPVAHMLRGRKYLCEACVEKAGKAIGMVTQPKYEEQLQATIDARNEADGAKETVKRLSESILLFARGDDVPDVDFLASLENEE